MYDGSRPFVLMGIVNVTPDSFYDGGMHDTTDAAVIHVRALLEQGAGIIDIGGASSRPGAAAVGPEEEAGRVIPVIRETAAFFQGPISIDTTSSSVARRAIEAGASWINDTSGGREDPDMIPLAAESGCTVVVMHSRGTPRTMQNDPRYKDVVSEVAEELIASACAFEAGGVAHDRIVLDPGIGFAKTAEHNVTLIRNIGRIVALGYPVVIGTSRKSFIGKITGRCVEERLCGSLASVAAAYLKGVALFRVHDVAATGDFLKVLTELSR